MQEKESKDRGREDSPNKHVRERKGQRENGLTLNLEKDKTPKKYKTGGGGREVAGKKLCGSELARSQGKRGTFPPRGEKGLSSAGQQDKPASGLTMEKAWGANLHRGARGSITGQIPTKWVGAARQQGRPGSGRRRNM